MCGFWSRVLAVSLTGAAATAGGQGAEAPPPGPGIYYEQEGSPDGPLARLEPTTMARAGANAKEMGRTLATTALTGGLIGGKPKMALYYSGSRAALRASSRPVFQFHFEASTASDPSKASGGAAMPDPMDQMDSAMPPGAKHPHDLALARLTIKKDERELIASMEMKPKDVVPIRVRHLAGSVYRVTPERTLEPGEYGFLGVPKDGAAGGGSDRLWDFGVDPQ